MTSDKAAQPRRSEMEDLKAAARTPAIMVPVWAVFEERGETVMLKDGRRVRSTYCRFCNSEVIPAGEKFDNIYDHRPACVAKGTRPAAIKPVTVASEPQGGEAVQIPKVTPDQGE